MDLSLRSFTSSDIRSCRQWAKTIGFERFQSRYTPHSYHQEDGSFCAERCLWYIVVVDGEDIGTVWLEKETPVDSAAVLGIMLGRQDLFGKGIGRWAVCQAIRQARNRLAFRSVELHVRAENTRAIACYRHCGFVVVEEGIKTDKGGCEIPFMTMRLDLETIPDRGDVGA